jgi:hypothetical protein
MSKYYQGATKGDLVRFRYYESLIQGILMKNSRDELLVDVWDINNQVTEKNPENVWDTKHFNGVKYICVEPFFEKQHITEFTKV